MIKTIVIRDFLHGFLANAGRGLRNHNKKLLIGGLVLIAALKSTASIYINLDSVNANSGPVDATAFLASYGITLTGVSPTGGNPSINNVNNWSGALIASTPNLLYQGASTSGESYTLNFNTPLLEFQFTRVESNPSTPTATPIWSATAYDAGDNVVGTVGDSSIDAFTFAPAQTYTLTASPGDPITSLTVYGNAENFADYWSVPIDNIYITPVPESSTIFASAALLVPFGFSAVRAMRKNRRK
jgi:hypothetical protein